MIELRKYQRECVDQILINIDKNIKKQCISLPTGGGKTLISAFLILELLKQNKTIFFLVANEALVLQTYDEFMRIGIDASIIKSGMDKYYNKYAKVQILMLQTYSARLDKMPNLNPDVIIMDETDYCYNGQMIKKVFEKHNESFIIGVTATPIDDKGYLLKGFDFYYNKITVKLLQNQGFLSIDKNYVPIDLDLSNIKIKSTGDFDEKELEEKCNQAYIIDDIINTYKRFDKGYKGIIFAISIKHAEKLTKAFNEAGINSACIHSKQKKITTNYYLNEHKNNNIRMLVSVGMTIRGYNDVNIIDCIFCRPTMSERLYKQAVGRAARMDHENKGFFRLFDYAGNINRFGLWSDDCIYSHNDKPKRIVEFEGIICPNCFEFIQERVNTCPNCNFILKEIREKKEREIEEKKKTSELIEYKSLSIIEELNKLIANGNSFYYHKLRPLKPFNLDVNIFDNTIKKLVKKCIQNNYNPNYIYYKIKDQFKNYK